VSREVLWAPWRMEYIAAQVPPGGCIFCDGADVVDRRQRLVLRVTGNAIVMLNRFPYGSGHLMVAPRRHLGDLGELSAAEYGALMDEVRGAARVLQGELRPGGMNIGINLGAPAGAGIADHLHWHLVPRWSGDTNFMPLLADVKVMPEHLLATYDRLLPHFG
jgi:ATP adenylyltransferase